jgi:tight adherence protein C
MSGILLPLIASIVVFLGIAIVFVGLARSSEPSTINDRLAQFTERTMSLEEMELQLPFSQRVIVPLTRSILTVLGKYGPKQSAERLRLNLQQAGNPGGLTPAMFVGIRMVLSLVLGGMFMFVTFQAETMPLLQKLGFSAIGFGLGYMLPVFWLGQQIKKRKNNIVKSLPDALDLLTVCVEAGLGFDLALSRLTEKWDDELAREFRRVIQDVRLGRARRDALKDMSDRCGVDDVTTFVAAIIQAEQLGVSISKILKIQSDQMRVRRRQRAQEKAQQAPVKMLFPMVFLIFPSLFVVILGPAIPRLLSAF